MRDLALKSLWHVFAVLLLSLAVGANCFASTITLQWDPVTAADLGGYHIYYSSPDSGAVPLAGTGATQGASPVDVANQTTATITGLDPSHAYYFAVTAYNTAGVESPYSNIIEVPELLAPTVAITSPSAASSTTGVLSVAVDASDNIGVSRVDFYVNGVLQGSDTGTPYLFSWDTTTVAAGAYTLSAKAYDAAGNVGASSNVSVTVVKDVTSPSVALISPSNGSTLRDIVIVTAGGSDDVGINRVEIYANGTLLTAGNVVPLSYTWATGGLANGSYTLSAKAYDAAGNVGTSAPVTVTVANDAISPTAAITAPAAGATVSGTAAVSVTASDNMAVTRVEFYVNGVLQGTDSAAPYTFSWNTAALANGAYALSAKAYDAAGNVGLSSNVTVTVANDKTPPTAAIAAPAAGSTLGGSQQIAVNASDNVGVTRVELFVNGVLQGTDSAAPYTFSWNTAALANGSYTLTAKAYDAAGNVGQAAAVTVTVFNDTIAPSVTSFTLPAISASLAVPVTLAASDNVGVKGYFVSESATAPAAGAVGWSATAPASFTFSGTGTRKAYAWAKDAAGNVSAAAQASVVIDTTAPTISFASPAAGSKVGSYATISASATDNTSVTKMQLYIDNVLQLQTASSSFSWTWNTKSYARGSHVLLIKAYDAANNVSSSTRTVYK